MQWSLRLLDEAAPDSQGAEARAAAAEWSPDKPGVYCFRCGVSAGPGEVTTDGCSECLGRRLPWDRLVRLGGYESPLDGWVRAMKFHRDWTWGPWFGEQLASRLPRPIGDSPAAVCAAPLHWRRRWSRGYDQAKLIARAVARARGWPCVDLLRRVRPTQPQSLLPLAKKFANVRDRFEAERVDLSGWTIWLVDDVKTSGATLSQCARLLRSRGAEWIGVAVAAVAVRHLVEEGL